MAGKKPDVKKVKLTDLKPDPTNANEGTERGQKIIEKSIHQTGLGRSVLVDKNFYLIAGNKTTENAMNLGLEDAIVVKTDGKQLVVVQREDLDLLEDDEANTARMLAYYDNQSSRVSLKWDANQIVADMGAGVNLKEMFTQKELSFLTSKVLLERANEDGESIGTRDEEIDAYADKWGTAPGQLWLIPSSNTEITHRLYIGDSTNENQVRILLDGQKPFLMVTDPPYGVNYNPSFRLEFDANVKRATGEVHNDDNPDWTRAYQLFPGDVAYVWHPSVHTGIFQDSLHRAGFDTRQMIIWNKTNLTVGRSNYHWKHEPCWYMVRKNKSSNWQGATDQTTVWDIKSANAGKLQEEGDESMGHSTQKPLECMRRPISNHTMIGDSVYDPFVGSGTTLVACEQLHRQGYGMEIDPRYAGMVLERMAGQGLEPVLAK